MSNNCPGCRLPPPSDWCWEAARQCPLNMPPRDINLHELWLWLAELERRINDIAGKPPREND